METLNPIHVVAAIFIKGEKVLACRRAPHKTSPGLWEFPGGKVEPGESPFAALEREIKEVSHLALSQGAFFEVYPREVAVEALTLGLSPGVSVAGTNKLDLNVAGQKIIMKSDRNVVEIEIRNDSDKHYRQVRFNMVTAPAIDLLHSMTEADGSQKTNGVTWMRRRS